MHILYSSIFISRCLIKPIYFMNTFLLDSTNMHVKLLTKIYEDHVKSTGIIEHSCMFILNIITTMYNLSPSLSLEWQR